MLAAISELSDVELSEVEAAVGTRPFQRGRGYARGKAALFSGVMDEGDLFAGGLTAEDIRGLLS